MGKVVVLLSSPGQNRVRGLPPVPQSPFWDPLVPEATVLELELSVEEKTLEESSTDTHLMLRVKSEKGAPGDEAIIKIGLMNKDMTPAKGEVTIFATHISALRAQRHPPTALHRELKAGSLQHPSITAYATHDDYKSKDGLVRGIELVKHLALDDPWSKPKWPADVADIPAFVNDSHAGRRLQGRGGTHLSESTIQGGTPLFRTVTVNGHHSETWTLPETTGWYELRAYAVSGTWAGVAVAKQGVHKEPVPEARFEVGDRLVEGGSFNCGLVLAAAAMVTVALTAGGRFVKRAWNNLAPAVVVADTSALISVDNHDDP